MMPAVLRDERDRALYQAIGQRVQVMRQGNAITQLELSREIGVTRSHISNIERGFFAVQVHTLYRIAVALGCELSVLLPEEEEYARYRQETRPVRSAKGGVQKGSIAHGGR